MGFLRGLPDAVGAFLRPDSTNLFVLQNRTWRRVPPGLEGWRERQPWHPTHEEVALLTSAEAPIPALLAVGAPWDVVRFAIRGTVCPRCWRMLPFQWIVNPSRLGRVPTCDDKAACSDAAHPDVELDTGGLSHGTKQARDHYFDPRFGPRALFRAALGDDD